MSTKLGTLIIQFSDNFVYNVLPNLVLTEKFFDQMGIGLSPPARRDATLANLP